MVWAIDYDSGEGSGDYKPGAGGFGFIHIDPSIWKAQKPVFSCEAPCNVALPAHPLPAPTTISVAGAATRTFLIPGVDNGAKVTKTVVTTIRYPPVTTSQVSLWPLGVPVGQGDEKSLTAHASIDVPPMTVTLSMGTTTPVHTKNATVIGGAWFVTKTVTPSPSPTDNDVVFPVWWRKGTPGPLCKGEDCGCVGRRCGRDRKTDRDIPHKLPCLSPLGCGSDGLPCLLPLGCSGPPCLNPFACTAPVAGGASGEASDNRVEEEKEDEEEEEEKCEYNGDVPQTEPDFVGDYQIVLNAPGKGSPPDLTNGGPIPPPPPPPPSSPSNRPTIVTTFVPGNTLPPTQRPTVVTTFVPGNTLPPTQRPSASAPPPNSTPRNDGTGGNGNGMIGKDPKSGGDNGNGVIGKDPRPGSNNGNGVIGKDPKSGGKNGDGFIGKDPKSGGKNGDGFIGKDPVGSGSPRWTSKDDKKKGDGNGYIGPRS